MLLKYSLIPFLILFFTPIAIAQHDHDDSHSHEETHGDDNHHSHHLNEIGIANSPVYFVNEKEFAYGLHIHYIRNIKDTKFGVGLGYERIFDEHKHNTIGIVGSYRPISELVFNVSPGVTYEDNESSEINFALHLETSYEFEVSNFHIGPVFEFAYDPEDYHISLGLHIGYGFSMSTSKRILENEYKL